MKREKKESEESWVLLFCFDCSLAPPRKLSGSDEKSLMETSDQSRKHCLIGILALLSYWFVSVPGLLILAWFSRFLTDKGWSMAVSPRIVLKVEMIQTSYLEAIWLRVRNSVTFGMWEGGWGTDKECYDGSTLITDFPTFYIYWAKYKKRPKIIPKNEFLVALDKFSYFCQPFIWFEKSQTLRSYGYYRSGSLKYQNLVLKKDCINASQRNSTIIKQVWWKDN